MKTAVSVPDHLFEQAEETARRLRISRSRLYATAIAEFLDRLQTRSITKRLNAVYSRKPAKIDPAFREAQVRMLGKNSW